MAGRSQALLRRLRVSLLPLAAAPERWRRHNTERLANHRIDVGFCVRYPHNCAHLGSADGVEDDIECDKKNGEVV
jgi:hypothetical protein